MENEEWRAIEGIPGFQVSNMGRVRSLDRICTRIMGDGRPNKRYFKGRDVPQKINKSGGYVIVKMYANGKTNTEYVHRLVASAFIPNPNNYRCVNHKDENKTNNRADNLEWCTHKYNNNYGTKPMRLSKVRKGMIRPTLRKAIDCFDYSTGEYITTYPAIIVAHKTLGIPQGSIMRVLSGKRKKAHGYSFKYSSVKS